MKTVSDERVFLVKDKHSGRYVTANTLSSIDGISSDFIFGNASDALVFDYKLAKNVVDLFFKEFQISLEIEKIEPNLATKMSQHNGLNRMLQSGFVDKYFDVIEIKYKSKFEILHRIASKKNVRIHFCGNIDFYRFAMEAGADYLNEPFPNERLQLLSVCFIEKMKIAHEDPSEENLFEFICENFLFGVEVLIEDAKLPPILN